MARKTKVVAEICLYGNHEAGAGWLAKVAGGALLGDGEPRRDRTFTQALWLACDAVFDAAVRPGLAGAGMARRCRLAQSCRVRVFAPGGLMMAETGLLRPGYYGDLAWGPAPVYAVSVEDILRHAE